MSEIPNSQEQKPEEPLEYNENTSLHKDKILIALVATDNGPAIYSNLKGRANVIMAKGEIEAFLTMILIKGDLKADEMRHKVVSVKNGIMGFIKGGKRF